jgi:multiple sugar transport system permease protein
MRLRRRDLLLLCGPFALLLSAGLLIPALLGLAATFTSWSPFGTGPALVGLQNYQRVLADREFGRAVRNVAVFTLLAVPAALILGLGLAALIRNRRHRVAWRVALLVPWLVSPVANGVMWHFLLTSSQGIGGYVLGWLGIPEGPSPLSDGTSALLALVAIEVWRTAPLVAFLALPGLLAIPAERWEDARLHGAPVTWVARHVVIASLAPLLLAITMLLTGLALGTFDPVVVLTGGGPGTATVTPALQSWNYAFRSQSWPMGAASGWLIALAVLLLGLVYLGLARRGQVGRRAARAGQEATP